MAHDPDPYRTLGLVRGATLTEVKRAYRRLAKSNHPDAAGDAALPRFLAIQAAYDQIIDTGSSGRSSPRDVPRRPWEADPARADATRRAYGGRSRRDRASARGTASAGRTASGSGSASGGSAPGGTAGTSGASGASGPSRANGGQGPGSTRERARAHGADADAGARSGGGAEPGPGDDDAGDGRPAPKATLGSTSYDGAAEGPFEPDWGGASWYGPSSGTYWTLNPREYADPRKHGPEYQARARRAAQAAASSVGSEIGDAGPDMGREPDARESRADARESGARVAGAPSPTPPDIQDRAAPEPNAPRARESHEPKAPEPADIHPDLDDPRQAGGLRARVARLLRG